MNLFPADEWQPKNLFCNIAVGVIGAAAVGAAATTYSASKAASAQENAANQASQTQMNMYNRTRADLLPYNQAGQGALSELQANNYYTAPVTMNEATLEQTPGYQFNLKYGLKAVQNNAAARGLGLSGAALKGASAFATGLADSTYQQQFQNAVTNQTNAYNRLMGVIGQGENAAAQTGNYGTQTASNIGQNTIGAGNAAAASYNTAGAAIGGAAQNIGGYMAYQGLYGGGGGGGYQIPSNGWITP